MKYKYYKSDFPLLVTIDAKAQQSGESLAITTRVPFVLRFWTSRCQCNAYECSSDGKGKCKNCVIVDNKHVMVYFDMKQAKLQVGKLMMEAEFLIANNHYDSDAIMNVKRYFDTGVELTDRADLDTDDAEINAIYVPIVLQAENTPVDGSIPVQDLKNIDKEAEVRSMVHNGGNFLPATTADAVLDPETNKSVTEQLKLLRDKTIRFNGVLQYKDIDTYNTMSHIGIYYIADSNVGMNGLLSIAFDYSNPKHIVQTMICAVTPIYAGNTISQYSPKASNIARRYINGAWTKWEATNDIQKILENVSELALKITRIEGTDDKTIIVDTLRTTNGMANGSTWYISSTPSNYTHSVIEVIKGDVVKITTGTKTARYALLASYTEPSNGLSVDYAQGFDKLQTIGARESLEIEITDNNCRYILVQRVMNGIDESPISIFVKGQNGTLKSLSQGLQFLDASVKSNKTDIDNIAKDLNSVKSVIGSGSTEIDVTVGEELGYLKVSAQNAVYIDGAYDGTKWRCNRSIALQNGDKVQYTSNYAASTDVVLFAIVDDSNKAIYSIKGDGTIKDISYTATKNCTCYVSYNTSAAPSFKIERSGLNTKIANISQELQKLTNSVEKTTNDIDSLSQDVETVKSIVGSGSISVDVTSGAALGYLKISAQNVVYVDGAYDGTKWRCKRSINLQVGDRVQFESNYAASADIVLLAIVDEGNNAIYSEKGDGTKKSITYTAIRDCTCSVTYNTSATPSFTIERSGLTSKIENNAKEIVNIKNTVKNTEEAVGAITTDVNIDTDNKGYLAISSGGAIYITGAYDSSTWRCTSADNSIEVKNGDRIKYTCSYKAADTVVLLAVFSMSGLPIFVVKGNGAAREIEYVATEDCKVRISYNTSSARSLFVYSDNISRSNAELIGNINESILPINKAKYDDRILNIAYSSIKLAPINSAEHFLTACKFGFNALKADMALTSDNKLICCHDYGFTLNDEDRITEYKSQSNTLIHNLTYEQVVNMEYNSMYSLLGYYAKPCGIEEFLRICKEHGKIPYLTLRVNYAEETLTELFSLLDKYSMRSVAIINLYDATFDRLDLIRRFDKDISVCYTLTNEIISSSFVENIKRRGNVSVMLDSQYIVRESENIKYALRNGVRIGAYNIDDYDDYKRYVDLGLSAFQIYNPLMPYNSQVISFNVTIEGSSAKLTQTTIDTNQDNYNKCYQADIVCDKDDKEIIVSNITTLGNYRKFEDGLPMWWRRIFPYIINVNSVSGKDCSVSWRNDGIHIKLQDLADDTYRVMVVI